MQSLPETGFLRLDQVLKLIPVSRSSWWAGIKVGRYPPGVKIPPRCTGWNRSDIYALIESINAQAEREREASAVGCHPAAHRDQKSAR